MQRVSWTAAACVMLADSAVAMPAPRQAAAEVAAAIERSYYDPARGRTIADGLRAAAARGEFDRLQTPDRIAVELTRRLQPLDAHFRVRHTPDAPPAATEATHAPDPTRALFERRGNYGFRRVEILPGNIGYLDLREFADIDFDDPNAPARAAADAAMRLLAGVDTIVVDLRGNGGGAPSMVGYLVSAFTPPGANIYNVFRFREGTESERPKKPFTAPDLRTPLYLLTSGRTASAAEAFAYTLQAARRATVIGDATAGAANPGRDERTPGGWLVFVSGGSPTNPITGGNWEGAGVRPDIAVAPADALVRAQRLALTRMIAAAPAGAAALDTRWALDALSAPAASASLATYAGAYTGATVVVGPDASLLWKQGRRPALALRPVAPDQFGIVGDPSIRLVFERDPKGRIGAARIRHSDGYSALWPRE